MQNNCSKDTAYAGFWVRFFAYMVDSIIVFFALLAIRLFLLGVSGLIEGTVFEGNILFQYTLTDIVLYVAQAVYFVLFTYCTGTTPGKRLLSLRVCSADGGKLTFFDVLYREVIGRFLCGLFLGIGYIVAGIDKQKRGIHDMLSDTRVIYGKKVKVYPVYQAQAAPLVSPYGGQPSPVYHPSVPPVSRQVTEETEGREQKPSQAASQQPPQPSQAVPQQPPQPQGGQYHMVSPSQIPVENGQSGEQSDRRSKERDS